MGKALGIVIVVALIAGGMYLFLSRQNSQSEQSPVPTVVQETQVSPATEESTEQTQTYTLEDVSQHATQEDCWFVINGSVYDVTEYIAGGKHPGGEAILKGCGKDATELFTTRPMGSGTDHSEKAYGFLENFKIGILQ
jgi:cytochrome b involved in lipid metabolism